MKFLFNIIFCISMIHVSISYTSQTIDYNQALASLQSATEELGLSNDQAQEVLTAFAHLSINHSYRSFNPSYGIFDDTNSTSADFFIGFPGLINSIKDLQKVAIAASLTDNILITLCLSIIMSSFLGQLDLIGGAFNINYNYAGPALTNQLYQNLILFYTSAEKLGYTTSQIGYMISTLFFKTSQDAKFSLRSENSSNYFNKYQSTFSKQQQSFINGMKDLDPTLIVTVFSSLASDPSISNLSQNVMQSILSIVKIAVAAQLSQSQIQQIIVTILQQDPHYAATINLQGVNNLTVLKTAAIKSGLTDNELITLWLINAALEPKPTILTSSSVQNIIAIYKAAFAAHIIATNMLDLVSLLYKVFLSDSHILTTQLTAQEVADIIAIYQAFLSSSGTNLNIAVDMITQYITLTVAQNVAPATAKTQVMKAIAQLSN